MKIDKFAEIYFCEYSIWNVLASVSAISFVWNSSMIIFYSNLQNCVSSSTVLLSFLLIALNILLRLNKFSQVDVQQNFTSLNLFDAALHILFFDYWKFHWRSCANETRNNNLLIKLATLVEHSLTSLILRYFIGISFHLTWIPNSINLIPIKCHVFTIITLLFILAKSSEA